MALRSVSISTPVSRLTTANGCPCPSNALACSSFSAFSFVPSRRSLGAKKPAALRSRFAPPLREPCGLSEATYNGTIPRTRDRYADPVGKRGTRFFSAPPIREPCGLSEATYNGRVPRTRDRYADPVEERGTRFFSAYSFSTAPMASWAATRPKTPVTQAPAPNPSLQSIRPPALSIRLSEQVPSGWG